MIAALLRRHPAISLTLVWLACAAAGATLPSTLSVFDLTEKWLGDIRLGILGPKMESRSDIVLVTITEATLAQLPYRFPIDRGVLANAVEYFNEAGVWAIGLDILFDQPTEPDKDKGLVEAVANSTAPVIVGWADGSEGLTAKQVEFLNRYLPDAVHAPSNLVKGERDGTVRWVFPGLESEGKYRKSFAAALADAVGVEAARETVPLFYRRGADGSVQPFPTFPLHLVKVLPKKWFTGKIVLIGADLPNEDRHRTPFAALVGNQEGSIPGVVIHAFALAQMLDGAHVSERGFGIDLILAAAAAGIGVLVVTLEFAAAIKIAFGLLSILAIWIVGFGLIALGGPLIPLFAPSMTLAAAVGISGVITGQRYRREKAHAEAMVQARSQSLAAMSHEIRTPINGVQGMAHVLLGTELNQEQHDYVETIEQSCDSLLVIINDFLDFSKLEANKFELEDLDFNLPRTVRQALSLLQARAHEKGIEIVTNFTQDLPEWL